MRWKIFFTLMGFVVLVLSEGWVKDDVTLRALSGNDVILDYTHQQGSVTILSFDRLVEQDYKNLRRCDPSAGDGSCDGVVRNVAFTINNNTTGPRITYTHVTRSNAGIYRTLIIYERENTTVQFEISTTLYVYTELELSVSITLGNNIVTTFPVRVRKDLQISTIAMVTDHDPPSRTEDVIAVKLGDNAPRAMIRLMGDYVKNLTTCYNAKWCETDVPYNMTWRNDTDFMVTVDWGVQNLENSEVQIELLSELPKCHSLPDKPLELNCKASISVAVLSLIGNVGFVLTIVFFWQKLKSSTISMCNYELTLVYTGHKTIPNNQAA